MVVDVEALRKETATCSMFKLASAEKRKEIRENHVVLY